MCCDAAVLQREVWESEVGLTTSFLFNYLNKSWQWSRLGWAGLGWAGAINHPRAELIMDTFQPAWAAPTSPAQPSQTKQPPLDTRVILQLEQLHHCFSLFPTIGVMTLDLVTSATLEIGAFNL